MGALNLWSALITTGSVGSAKRRAQVGKKLQQIRSKINDLPVVASKYQVLIKGKGNFEKCGSGQPLVAAVAQKTGFQT